MIKFWSKHAHDEVHNYPHPLAEPQQIRVRENNEYWASAWSIPHRKPNLLEHLELCRRMQFFEMMIDTHGSLFPWAHLLLICKDDKWFDLNSSLQLIKAFVCSTLEEEGAGFKAAHCKLLWLLTVKKFELLSACVLVFI